MNAAIDCISVRNHASKGDLIASSHSLFTGACCYVPLRLLSTYCLSCFSSWNDNEAFTDGNDSKLRLYDLKQESYYSCCTK